MSDSIEFKVNVCGWHPDVGALISASEAQRVIEQVQQESNQLKARIAELERELEIAEKHLHDEHFEWYVDEIEQLRKGADNN